MKILKLVFILKKNDTLRYVKFIYTKSQTLCKKQDNLRYVFIYKNPALCVTRFFIEFLKFTEGGDIYFFEKLCTFRDIFILKKQITLRYFAIQKELCTLQCCLDPITRIITVYFQTPVGLGMFLRDCFQKKQENIPSFQLSHFTRKYVRNIIKLKLVILNTMNFRLVLGLLGGN